MTGVTQCATCDPATNKLKHTTETSGTSALHLRQIHGNKNKWQVSYLLQLAVFLQDQINNVTDDRDFPLREAPLQELLLGQQGLILEDIS